MPKAALSNNLQGALWILASCLAATVMTVGVKMASDGLSSTQIVFVRCVFSLVMTAPFVIGYGKRLLFSRRWKMHLVRGAIGAISMNAGFYALSNLPITTASVLFFSTKRSASIAGEPRWSALPVLSSW